MNTSKFQLKKGLFFTLCALGASALMSSCSNEDIQAAAGGSQDEDRVPVELQASVIGAQIAGTRATDVNNDAFQTPFQDFDIFINNGLAGASTWTTLLYDMQTAGTLIAPASPHYFPSGISEVSVYGWYPSTNAAKTFTVQEDQNSDENYVKSDLMYATPVNCTRTLTNGSWVVTPAPLEFKHVMSKLKVSVTPATGITVESVKLLNAHKGYSINIDNPSYPSFTVDNQTADITLKSSGFAVGTAFDCYGVIPAQTIAASTDFIEVKAKNAAGTAVSVKFKFQNQSTLEQGKIYTLNLKLGQIRSDATATIFNWNSTTGNAEVTVGPLEDPAAMKSGDVMQYNPLYYVAQYNVKTINGVVDPATKTVEEPDGTVASETKFYTTHYGNENVFKFADVANLAKNGTAAVNDASGYHIPDVYEQNGVIPNKSGSELQYNSDFNIFTFGNGPLSKTEGKMKIAGTDVAAGTTSWWLKNGNNDYYAVRFVNQQNYASAWHYKFISGSGLLIESYILATVPTDEASAKKILNALPYTNVWEGGKNEAPAATAPTTNAVVQRFLPACGYENTVGSTGKATTNVGTNGNYWSATEGSNADNGMNWGFGNGALYEYSNSKLYGFSVRLFRD